MSHRTRWTRAGLSTALLTAAALAALAAHPGTLAAQAGPAAGRARVAFTHVLPRLDGGRLAATLVEVVYGPGEASPPHSHACAVIGYVVEGAIRSQVQGEPAAVYHAGESFYERPGGVHAVSANASGVAPARLLAYFTCDRAAPLTTPAPGPTGGKK